MSAELVLRGLRKAYPGQSAAALDDVDLTVPAGSCTAVLGPSGSGKSTLLRLVAGLDDPTSGTVEIDGVDVTGVVAERRGVGMVFQRPMLFPHLSVVDNVGFAARAAGSSRSSSREQAHRYLEMVHLSHLADRSVGAISGGQAQRVALARSLAGSPRVMLLDEPFSALDPVLRTEMHDLVREIRADLEQTVVLVTHDQQEAAALADHVAVLVDGSLEHHSDVASAYTRPSTTAVNRLMGGLNEIPGRYDGGVHHSDLGQLDAAAADSVTVGPAILLLRHEMISIATESEAADGGLPIGVVRAVRPAGLRCTVEVQVGEAMVTVELPVGRQVDVGSRVGLDIAPEARFVVDR
ncbi:MAG: ABC transporter ATP-binding protein [Rhodococcus sp. (in: high G+C Gram-positive bacteria)]